MKRIETPSKNTLACRKWRDSHKHPCIDCGKPCSWDATRCQSCNQKTLNLPRRREYFCAECGQLVSDKLSYRCKECDAKFKRGKNHPNWKGGRRRNKDGYILLHKPRYHRADINGYVFEHIFVWEQANNVLPQDMQIHHLNGIKDDNSLSNLIAINPLEHRKLHRKSREISTK